EKITSLADNFRGRSKYFTPVKQQNFVRALPDSPQLKLLMNQ
ncbi:5446_t:CDS:1, partial [Paraglomus occultum]